MAEVAKGTVIESGKTAAVKLPVVANTTDIHATQELTDAGVHFGITGPSTASGKTNYFTGGNERLYFDSSATNPLGADLAAGTDLYFRYFMEFSPLYTGPGNEIFGYKLTYSLTPAKTDMTGSDPVELVQASN